MAGGSTRKALRKLFEGVKINKNWRKRCNKIVTLQSGGLGTLLFVRISRLHWIGHVNRKDVKRKVSQVINSNPQGSRI